MGFGIAGLILAIVAIFATIGFNIALIWIALGCAAVAAASQRGGGLAVATWIISAVTLIVLSPLTLAALLGSSQSSDPGAVQFGATILYITLAAFAAPIISPFFGSGASGMAVSADHINQTSLPIQSEVRQPATKPAAQPSSPVEDVDAESSSSDGQQLPATYRVRGLSTGAFVQILLLIVFGAVAADFVVNGDHSIVGRAIGSLLSRVTSPAPAPPEPTVSEPPLSAPQAQLTTPNNVTSTLPEPPAPETDSNIALPAGAPPDTTASLAGPSFDCAVNHAPVERVICADGDLAAKDRQMAALYHRLHERLSGQERTDLVEAQRRWLLQRAQCRDPAITACISQLYVDRIRDLELRLGEG